MQKNKEELESEISDLYKSLREEVSPNNWQTLFFQFFGKIQLWYNNCFSIPKRRKPEFEELGVEIWERLNYLIKIEKEPTIFIPYLIIILKTAIADYYLKINCLKGGIKTSEDITNRIYKIK